MKNCITVSKAIYFYVKGRVGQSLLWTILVGDSSFCMVLQKCLVQFENVGLYVYNA